MVSASPMASLPPGPAGVLPEPGTTGITLALPGYSWTPQLPAMLAAKTSSRPPAGRLPVAARAPGWWSRLPGGAGAGTAEAGVPPRPAGTGFRYAERTVIQLRTVTAERVERNDFRNGRLADRPRLRRPISLHRSACSASKVAERAAAAGRAALRVRPARRPRTAAPEPAKDETCMRWACIRGPRRSLLPEDQDRSQLAAA